MWGLIGQQPPHIGSLRAARGSAIPARPLPETAYHLAGRLRRRAAVERRRRVVLDLEPDLAGRLVAGHPPDELEREIDARGDPRRGRELAVEHVPVIHHLDAVLAQ